MRRDLTRRLNDASRSDQAAEQRLQAKVGGKWDTIRDRQPKIIMISMIYSALPRQSINYFALNYFAAWA
jgi:hypothetical protein